jgi:hypothetical protein
MVIVNRDSNSMVGPFQCGIEDKSVGSTTNEAFIYHPQGCVFLRHRIKGTVTKDGNLLLVRNDMNGTCTGHLDTIRELRQVPVDPFVDVFIGIKSLPVWIKETLPSRQKSSVEPR